MVKVIPTMLRGLILYLLTLLVVAKVAQRVSVKAPTPPEGPEVEIEKDSFKAHFLKQGNVVMKLMLLGI